MKVYNMLNKQIEEFVPYDKNEVTMYTCGPTVYNYAHIGNLRTYIFEDVLEKSLKYLNYMVKRVMNLTDVGHLTSDGDTGEDKMTKRAKATGLSAPEIADFYTKAFFEDFTKLNIRKPDIVEKATNHINDYIEVIKVLIEKGYAYLAGGNVYFDITKAKDYYKLSGLSEDNLKIGVRDDVKEDKYKKNPYDFALWFTKSKFEDQQQKWNSPWGVGYPGWHIECSTLASIYLGEHLDIHCGGIDLVFPHHTNEIAQSEAYFGHKWCNYWMYGEYLNDNGGKMSKSNGEFLTLSLLESKGYNPLSYRFLCLTSHYRKQLVFSYDSLNTAENAYLKLRAKTSALEQDGDINQEMLISYKNKFKEAIDNDLNTASMLTLVFELLKDHCLNNSTKIAIISSYDQVLSLDLLKKIKQQTNLNEEYIQKKIAERQVAKDNKDYVLADKIRQELLNEGIKLIDTKETTNYEII